MTGIPTTGLVVMDGRWFTVVSRKMLHDRNIKVRKTGLYVDIDGTIKPVWQKDSWDLCREVSELFNVTGIECELKEYLIKE